MDKNILTYTFLCSLSQRLWRYCVVFTSLVTDKYLFIAQLANSPLRYRKLIYNKLELWVKSQKDNSLSNTTNYLPWNDLRIILFHAHLQMVYCNSVGVLPVSVYLLIRSGKIKEWGDTNIPPTPISFFFKFKQQSLWIKTKRNQAFGLVHKNCHF